MKSLIKSGLSLIILISIMLSTDILSQSDSTKIYTLTLTDNTELTGFITNESDSLLVLKTISGIELRIERKFIADITISKGEVIDGQFQRYDPNSTRLFFGPTARTIEQGKGYFSAFELFIPFLAVGVTDFLMLSGGMSLIPGAEEQMFYFGPKVRFFGSDNFSLGAGMIYAHVGEENFGITYGATTLGSKRAAFTFGIGFGFENGDLSDSPFMILGGEVQLSNSVKLLTENWIIPELQIISFGIRFFGDNLAADIALITSLEDTEGWPFIPWVGFVYNW